MGILSQLSYWRIGPKPCVMGQVGLSAIDDCSTVVTKKDPSHKDRGLKKELQHHVASVFSA
jgi:hypothetical protein